jgi:mRNA interferase MazF
VRGDVYELPKPRDARGREQKGRRFAVVVQSDDLPLSTWIVCPTSRSARPTSFRPTVEVLDEATQVQVDQMAAVDPERLGNHVGQLSLAEMQEVDEAIKIMLGLDL